MFTMQSQGTATDIRLWPATQYLQSHDDIESILESMANELDARLNTMEAEGKALEAHRLKKRVEYDIRMIRET